MKDYKIVYVLCYLHKKIVLFPRPDNKEQRGVKFRHSTRNTSKIYVK